jgi:hypothetical protein
MTLNELIALAEEGTPRMSDVELAAKAMGVPVEEVLNEFARLVAVRFCDGEYPFNQADAAMNGLFGLLAVIDLPDFVWAVHGAFDEGEYTHAPLDGPQGEDRTRAMLREVLGRQC